MLDGTHNQIHSIPDELGQLSHLEQLYLRHNRVTHLPLLTHCSSLKVRLGYAFKIWCIEQLVSIIVSSDLPATPNLGP